MHHIQRKVLQQLMYASSLNYAKMRSAGIESNHFAYHLDQLMRAKLVAKDNGVYSLTDNGLALVDRASHNDMRARLQPHIVTSLYITNDQGQILLYEHCFQPYLNRYGPPQGRLHYAEHIADAAQRELLEKTGLSGVSLTHRGIAYIHAVKGEVDISKILAHVFSGTVTGTPELATSKDGVAVWKDPAQLAEHQCMPGFIEVRELLLAEPACLFFTEIETQMA